MDKFKFGLFDVFVYSLPGVVILISIDLTFLELQETIYGTVFNIISQVNNLKLYSILLGLITSYIFGFVLHFFGYNYFHYVGKRIWKRTIGEHTEGLSGKDSNDVLIRHYSKENFIYVELWNTLRAMSFNTSLAFVFMTGVLITKIIYNSLLTIPWILTILCGIGIVIVMLRRAVTFHIWSHRTSTETVKMILKNNIENKP